MSKRRQSEAADFRVSKVRDALEISYNYAEPYMREAKRLLKSYFNQIEEKEWGTLSECRIPVEWSQGETLLASTYDYFFHAQKKMFRFIPEEQGIDQETVMKNERFFEHKLFSQMELASKMMTVLRAAFIYPCSYALIDSKTITPPTTNILGALSEDGQTASEEIVTVGAGFDVPNIRYVDFFSVFPAPYGATPEEVDWIIIVDFVDEFTIKDGIDRGILKGNIDEIKSKAHILAPYADSAMVYARYASDPENQTLRGVEQNRDQVNKDLPKRIPVIKYYGKDEIIWAVDDLEIYHHSNKGEILSNPLVKFSCCPINEMWFSASPLQFTSDLSDLINITYNSLIDTLSYHLSPPVVANRSMLYSRGNELDRRPNGVIETTGDPARAVQYLNNPALPPNLFQFPDDIRGLLGVMSGLPESLRGGGGAGIVRGGSQALQSLLQQAGARTTLMSESLQHTGFEPMLRKIWFMMQKLDNSEESFPMLNKENVMEVQTITTPEIRNMMRIDMLTGKRMMNKFADAQLRLQMIPYLSEIQGIDQRLLLDWLIPDEDNTMLFGPNQAQPAGQEDQNIANQLQGAGVGGGQNAG